MKFRTLFAALLVALAVLASCSNGSTAEGPNYKQAHEKVKAGFIYVGPVGDYGWTAAHEIARKQLDDKYDWLETVYVESVPEGDAARFIDQLVAQQNCDIIFTTSFGYMDATVEAAKKYPNKTFMHCSGFKQADNLGTYYAELYQAYYLNGLMAGALTKSGKVGYVGAFPIPEVVRHINAYALGVKAANPAASVSVRWINSWYDPTKAKEAAEALIAEGVDAMAFTEDSPSVIEVAAAHTKAGQPVHAFSHYSPMQDFGPEAVPSGQLVDWAIMYDKILNDFKAGTWNNADLWWKMGEGAAVLGAKLNEPVNTAYIAPLQAVQLSTPDLGTLSAYDLVMARYEAMKAGSFEPFTGPLADNKGNVKVAEGAVATKEELLSILWYVDNIIGDVPTSN